MASKFKTLMGYSNGASFKRHYGVSVSEWIRRDVESRGQVERSDSTKAAWSDYHKPLVKERPDRKS